MRNFLRVGTLYRHVFWAAFWATWGVMVALASFHTGVLLWDLVL